MNNSKIVKLCQDGKTQKVIRLLQSDNEISQNDISFAFLRSVFAKQYDLAVILFPFLEKDKEIHFNMLARTNNSKVMLDVCSLLTNEDKKIFFNCIAEYDNIETIDILLQEDIGYDIQEALNKAALNGEEEMSKYLFGKLCGPINTYRPLWNSIKSRNATLVSFFLSKDQLKSDCDGVVTCAIVGLNNMDLLKQIFLYKDISEIGSIVLFDAMLNECDEFVEFLLPQVNYNQSLQMCYDDGLDATYFEEKIAQYEVKRTKECLHNELKDVKNTSSVKRKI